MTRHKHYEAIVAFAEGRNIEYQSDISGLWVLWVLEDPPSFYAEDNYRVRDGYCELKEAFARGEKIEVYIPDDDVWHPCAIPSWFHSKGPAGYRIVPKPRPDYVVTGWLQTGCGPSLRLTPTKVTLDGATGAVKHVEIVK